MHKRGHGQSAEIGQGFKPSAIVTDPERDGGHALRVTCCSSQLHEFLLPDPYRGIREWLQGMERLRISVNPANNPVAQGVKEVVNHLAVSARTPDEKRLRGHSRGTALLSRGHAERFPRVGSLWRWSEREFWHPAGNPGGLRTRHPVGTVRARSTHFAHSLEPTRSVQASLRADGPARRNTAANSPSKGGADPRGSCPPGSRSTIPEARQGSCCATTGRLWSGVARRRHPDPRAWCGTCRA